MGAVFSVIILAALTLLVLFSIFTLMRGFLRGIKDVKAPAYVPPLDPNPPSAIVRTGCSQTVAIMSIAWGLLHVVAVAAWSAGRLPIPVTVGGAFMAGYVLIAAVLVVIGGVMLLQLEPWGRRVISWGHFLLGVMAFIIGGALLAMPYKDELPLMVQRWAPFIIVAMAAHLVMDTALGASAQQVGKAFHKNARLAHVM